MLQKWLGLYLEGILRSENAAPERMWEQGGGIEESVCSVKK